MQSAQRCCCSPPCCSISLHAVPDRGRGVGRRHRLVSTSGHRLEGTVGAMCRVKGKRGPLSPHAVTARAPSWTRLQPLPCSSSTALPPGRHHEKHSSSGQDNFSPSPCFPKVAATARQIIPSSSKNKGVFPKRWSPALTAGRRSLSPCNDFGSASTRGCSGSTALSGGLTCATVGLGQPGGLQKAWCLRTPHWDAWMHQGHATGEHHDSRATTAHQHCGTHGEVGIAHAAHPGAWGKSQAAERDCWLSKESQPLQTESAEHRPRCRFPCAC